MSDQASYPVQSVPPEDRTTFSSGGCEYDDPDRDHRSNSEMYAELAALERPAAGADPYARRMGKD